MLLNLSAVALGLGPGFGEKPARPPLVIRGGRPPVRRSRALKQSEPAADLPSLVNQLDNVSGSDGSWNNAYFRNSPKVNGSGSPCLH